MIQFSGIKELALIVSKFYFFQNLQPLTLLQSFGLFVVYTESITGIQLRELFVQTPLFFVIIFILNYQRTRFLVWNNFAIRLQNYYHHDLCTIL